MRGQPLPRASSVPQNAGGLLHSNFSASIPSLRRAKGVPLETGFQGTVPSWHEKLMKKKLKQSSVFMHLWSLPAGLFYQLLYFRL